jgi:hypothetical protein
LEAQISQLKLKLSPLEAQISQLKLN